MPYFELTNIIYSFNVASYLRQNLVVSLLSLGEYPMSALPPILIAPNTPPTANEPGKFSPQDVTANAGDNLTWTNNDSNAHWPAPSAANKTGWFQFQIPPGSQSPGTLALGPNTNNVTAATPGSPTVFTTRYGAPATGVQVKLTYSPSANPPSAWQTAVIGKT